MHKLVVLYGKPADPEHFRQHYEEVHVPLAKKVPGIRALRYSLDVAGVPPDPALSSMEHDFDVFCAFEAEWDDFDAMLAALGSAEGEAVVGDVPNYATGGYIRFHYDV